MSGRIKIKSKDKDKRPKIDVLSQRYEFLISGQR